MTDTDRSYEDLLAEITLERGGRHHYPFSEEVYEELAREKYEAGTKQRESNRRRASRKRTSNPGQDKYTREEVWEKCGGVCYLCHQPMIREWTPTNRNPCFTVEHIVPLSQGGSDTFSNVNGAHMSCNSKKGRKLEA